MLYVLLSVVSVCLFVCLRTVQTYLTEIGVKRAMVNHRSYYIFATFYFDFFYCENRLFSYFSKKIAYNLKSFRCTCTRA